MQITLIETEVKEAIETYLKERVQIPSGTSLQIDLSPTRGAEGVKAIVELVPTAPATKQTGTKKVTGTAATTATVAPEIAQALHKTPVLSATPKAAEPTPEPVADAASETTTDEPETTQDAAVVEGATVQPTPTGDEPVDGEDDGQQAAEQTPPAAAPVKSLFANLRKPENK